MEDTIEDTSFGALLSSFRRQRGLKQLALARKLGMKTRNTVSAWERNLYLPDGRHKIMAIAEVLNLDELQRNRLLYAAGYALEPVAGPELQTTVPSQPQETHVAHMVVGHMEMALGAPFSPVSGRRDCYQQVSRPINYIERPEILASVRAQILTYTFPVALTSAVKGKPTALHGMGGIGKTVIARALCDDPAVQNAFPDGILWATLGQVPDLLSQLRLWIEMLGGRLSENAPSVESLKSQLAQLLSNRACLLVLDDVWKRVHVEVFRVDAPRCRLLLTTRDAEIAREVGAQVQAIPVMTEQEAVTFLEEWADGHLAEIARALKEQTVKRLGYLPLAVRLAGAQLQRKSPEEWLRDFDVRRLKSSRLETLHDSLVQTFLLSLDALDEQARRLYLALAIFKEDEEIPQIAIEKLWQGLEGLDMEATSDLLHDLAARALLDLSPPDVPLAMRLHDLLRDLIGTLLGNEERLAAHQSLLLAYRHTCTGTDWSTAPDDGYLYDHLAYHLATAGCWEDLTGLFANQRWMHVRLPQRNFTYDGYLADLAVSLESATSETKRQIETDQEPSGLANCLRFTLIRTSINSLAGNYPPELVAQTVKTGLWSVERALSVAGKIPDAEQRARVYAALQETGRLNQEQYEQAQWFGVRAALTLHQPPRARALAALAPHLTGALLQQLLPVVSASPDDLIALAPHLTGALLQQALQAVLAIKEESKRARALAAMAPQLTGDLLQQALQVALALEKEWPRARALTALASRLPLEQRSQTLQQALQATLALRGKASMLAVIEGWDETALAEALAALAPQLTGALLQQALQAALVLNKESERAEVLVALAPHLTGALLQQALQAVLAWGDKWVPSKADTLAVLALQMPLERRSQTLRQALQAAMALGSESMRAEALTALVPRLPPERRSQTLQQALQAALAIKEEWQRAKALAALAPQLTGALLQQALQAALALKGGLPGKSKLLAALAPQLTGALLQQALQAALALGDEPQLAEVLTILVPRLPPEQCSQTLQQALRTALAMSEKWPRAKTLIALAPQLPPEQRSQTLQQALQAILALMSEKWQPRAEALAALVSQLTGDLLQQALQAVLALKDESTRAEALVVLAPQLTGALLQQALQAALALEEWPQVKALTALAPQLPPEQRSQALQQALHIALTLNENRWFQVKAKALAALAPHLTGALLDQALQAVPTMKEWEQADVLVALAPQMTGVVLHQALQMARALKIEWVRAKALTALAPQLPPEQCSQTLQQALQAALTIENEWQQADALIALAPQLADSLLQQALQAALAMWEGSKRAELLTTSAPQLPPEQRSSPQQALFEDPKRVELLMALAPQLPPEQCSLVLQQALQVALAINEELPRSNTLEDLAPQLSGGMLQQALQAASALEDKWLRVITLTTFLPIVSDQAPLLKSIRQLMLDVLSSRERRFILSTFPSREQLPREAVLRHYIHRRLFRPPILTPEVLCAITSHIIEICQDWHWL